MCLRKKYVVKDKKQPKVEKVKYRILTSQPDMLGLLELRAAPSCPEIFEKNKTLTQNQASGKFVPGLRPRFSTMKLWESSRALGTILRRVQLVPSKSRARLFTTSVKNPATAPKARVPSKLKYLKPSNNHGSSDLPNDSSSRWHATLDVYHIEDLVIMSKSRNDPYLPCQPQYS
jgi:hypothetical protein